VTFLGGTTQGLFDLLTSLHIYIYILKLFIKQSWLWNIFHPKTIVSHTHTHPHLPQRLCIYKVNKFQWNKVSNTKFFVLIAHDLKDSMNNWLRIVKSKTWAEIIGTTHFGGHGNVNHIKCICIFLAPLIDLKFYFGQIGGFHPHINQPYE
jgi:hypothetical protein